MAGKLELQRTRVHIDMLRFLRISEHKSMMTYRLFLYCLKIDLNNNRDSRFSIMAHDFL